MDKSQVLTTFILHFCDWVSLLSLRCVCRSLCDKISYKDVENKCLMYLNHNLGKCWEGYPPGFSWPKNKPLPDKVLYTFMCKNPKNMHGFFMQMSSSKKKTINSSSIKKWECVIFRTGKVLKMLRQCVKIMERTLDKTDCTKKTRNRYWSKWCLGKEFSLFRNYFI